MKKAYLAGGMEKRADNGKTWRRIITPLLKEVNIDVYNPCLEEGEIFEKHGITPIEFANLNKSRNVDLCKAVDKDIIDNDFDAIDACDFVIVFLDEFIGGGTLAELPYAYRKGKPVYAIKYVSYNFLNHFTLGALTEEFRSIEECVDFMGKCCHHTKIT